MARSDLRPQDAREPLRGDGVRLSRRRSVNTDKFFIPDDLMRDGLSYEWKRNEVMGQKDVEHQVMLVENHWQPVQASDMPGMMPSGYDGVVTRGGLVLMARPSYLTQEAQQEVVDISRQMVASQESRLGLSNQGQAPRVRPTVNRSYEGFDAKSVRIPA